MYTTFLAFRRPMPVERVCVMPVLQVLQVLQVEEPLLLLQRLYVTGM